MWVYICVLVCVYSIYGDMDLKSYCVCASLCTHMYALFLTRHMAISLWFRHPDHWFITIIVDTIHVYSCYAFVLCTHTWMCGFVLEYTWILHIHVRVIRACINLRTAAPNLINKKYRCTSDTCVCSSTCRVCRKRSCGGLKAAIWFLFCILPCFVACLRFLVTRKVLEECGLLFFSSRALLCITCIMPSWLFFTKQYTTWCFWSIHFPFPL